MGNLTKISPELQEFFQKAKGTPPDEFTRYYVNKMSKLFRERSPKYDTISKELRERYRPDFTSNDIWFEANNIPPIVYQKGKIIAKVFPNASLQLKEDDKKIIREILDFAYKKHPDLEWYITIGLQPISVGGGKAFRMGIPKAIPKESWLLYEPALLDKFGELIDKYGAKEVSTAYDIFHEMAHRWTEDEKEADKFAYKLSKEFFEVQSKKNIQEYIT